MLFAFSISFILDRKRSIALSFGQTSSPSPPTRYLKTLHTDSWYLLRMHIPDGRLVIVGAQRVHVRSSRSRVRITLQELFLIWLGGRITSPRVWFGAGGQGVTLKLAWGPSNSSPWNLRFVFVVFFIFPSLSSLYVLFYFLFPTIAEHYNFGPLWYLSVMVLVRLGCFFSFFYLKLGAISLSLFMLLLLSLLSPNNFFSNFHLWFMLVESDSCMAIVS